MTGWILAAAMALAAAPAQPQPQPGAPQDDGASELARYQAAIRELRETLLRPGERVEGWDRGGADPDGEVRRLGADRFYMVSRSDTGAGVSILTDRPIADFAPAGWRIVDSYGQAGERLSAPQVDFQPLSARYVFAARIDYTKVNDVACYSNFSHALLYEVPGAPADPDDDILPMMFRVMILAFENQTVCVRAEGDRERGYTSRFFMPDGRSLPALDDPSERMTIVPAAPVDQLIAPPPPRPAAGTPGES
jgi:hypothetical protein